MKENTLPYKHEEENLLNALGISEDDPRKVMETVLEIILKNSVAKSRCIEELENLLIKDTRIMRAFLTMTTHPMIHSTMSDSVGIDSDALFEIGERCLEGKELEQFRSSKKDADFLKKLAESMPKDKRDSFFSDMAGDLV